MSGQWLVRVVTVPPRLRGRGELDQVIAAALHVAKETEGQEPQLPADVAVREALAVVQFGQVVVVAAPLDDVVALVDEVALAEDAACCCRAPLVVVPLGLLEMAEVLGTSSLVLMAK